MNDKIDYILQLADNTLILGQRNAEWCGHGPVLEQDIAITNISLDLIGQARNFYQYAALLKENGATEDTLAYLRNEREYKNCLLTELPNGDWAQTILKQFFFSCWQWLLYEQLQQKKDVHLAAIAEKSLKEVSYHLRWSSEWVIRLGDGTEESHNRMLDAIETLWRYTGELFIPAEYERSLVHKGLAVDCSLLKKQWTDKVQEIFNEATLYTESKNWDKLKNAFQQEGGKKGIHTEHMGYILSELQYMQRAYPGCEW